MAQNGKMSDSAAPPFATKGGAPANQGTTASGGNDFLTNPAGGSSKSGGRDFSKESRPQPPNQAPPDLNQSSIPAGGRLPFPSADPSMGGRGGSIGAVADAEKKVPFKLK